MNKNINLVEILKNCPKGFKLYSSIYGEVEFSSIVENTIYQIALTCGKGRISFSKEGFFDAEMKDAECTLFPSKDQRDWSKFSAPWYKKERFDPNTLKPFDRVLMRDDKGSIYWRCAFFSHKREEERTPYKYAATYGSYKFCIPYNEETKHLVGTTDEAPEYYRYWEP